MSTSIGGAVQQLFRAANREVPPRLQELAKRHTSSLTADEYQYLESIGETFLRSFFEAASDGIALVPRSRIKDHFGRTLAENYPEAGPAFLRMATTYWTLKLVLQDAFHDRDTVGYEALSALERHVGALFFPTPGPMKIDPKKRARDQRLLLSKLAPRIDADEFIRHNPILRRDRLSFGSGWLQSLSENQRIALIVAILILLIVLIG